MINETPDTNETAPAVAIDEEYERSAGHQMHLLSQTFRQLESGGRLGRRELAGLKAAIGALDDALVELDVTAQGLVVQEIAEINRRMQAVEQRLARG